MQKYRVETKNGNFLGIIEDKRQFKKFKEDLHKYNKYVKDEDILLVKVTEHIIFDNYDVCSEDNLKECKELFLEDGYAEEDITEEEIINRCYDNSNFWFDNEREQLMAVSEGRVIAIADVGRWNGRITGYKELNSLEDVLYSSCDYEKVYVDANGDLYKKESHHDGDNSILYRYWKEGLTEQQRENFLNKIYKGEVTSKDITRYTRKAGIGIANTYGWTVRGGENKYKNIE